jgi:pimeloyl-ACP methyl ester carboxylesterase
VPDAPSFVQLADQRLEVRRIAAAAPGRPVLVFLHEGLGCAGLWRDFPDRVAAATGLGAIVYSRAGYGRSSPVAVPRPLTYMHHEALDVLPRLLDALALDDVILVGHSDGASIALVHAGGADPHRRVRALVLEAPHVLCEALTVASIEKAREAYEQGDLRARLARWHGDNVDVAFRGWNRAWLDPAFTRWNIEEYLPGVRAPILVIQGRDDEYGTAEQYRRIEAARPGTEVVLLDACGHAPHRDQPEATLGAMARFVSAAAAAKAPPRPP